MRRWECQQTHAGKRTQHQFRSPVKTGVHRGWPTMSMERPWLLANRRHTPYAGFWSLLARAKRNSALSPKSEERLPGRDPANQSACRHPPAKEKKRALLCGSSLCPNRLAEFAPAGAKKIESVFPGDMRLGKNSSRPANVRAPPFGRVRCGRPQLFGQKRLRLFRSVQGATCGSSLPPES